MSENITIPSARVPMVDDKGMITREWLVVINGIFQRVGGFEGFSNQELYGDASALQSYDELLGRIGATEAQQRMAGTGEASSQELGQRIAALEAQNRSLGQAVQMLAMGMSPSFDSIARAESNVFDTIKVRGDALLSSARGATKVRGGVSGSSAVFQVGGTSQLGGNTTVNGLASVRETGGEYVLSLKNSTSKDWTFGVRSVGMYLRNVTDGATRLEVSNAGLVNIPGEVTVTGDATASLFKSTHGLNVAGVRVVYQRVAGMPAFVPYAGQTIGASYSQAQIQELDTAAKNASVQCEKITNALRAHGLIGD